MAPAMPAVLGRMNEWSFPVECHQEPRQKSVALVLRCAEWALHAHSLIPRRCVYPARKLGTSIAKPSCSGARTDNLALTTATTMLAETAVPLVEAVIPSAAMVAEPAIPGSALTTTVTLAKAVRTPIAPRPALAVVSRVIPTVIVAFSPAPHHRIHVVAVSSPTSVYSRAALPGFSCCCLPCAERGKLLLVQCRLCEVLLHDFR
mmetsp:Transcript_29629/g.90915  ORF Transcript_29629/g.90915 Transcript_29629/m.90915 type:complete len:204 (-) Transcript_29629:170-781(-)